MYLNKKKSIYCVWVLKLRKTVWKFLNCRYYTVSNKLCTLGGQGGGVAGEEKKVKKIKNSSQKPVWYRTLQVVHVIIVFFLKIIVKHFVWLCRMYARRRRVCTYTELARVSIDRRWCVRLARCRVKVMLLSPTNGGTVYIMKIIIII